MGLPDPDEMQRVALLGCTLDAAMDLLTRPRSEPAPEPAEPDRADREQFRRIAREAGELAREFAKQYGGAE